MYTPFEVTNLYVYNTARIAVFDAIIWCLGPLVDDSREYGLARCLLAAVTRKVCRTWIALTSADRASAC